MNRTVRILLLIVLSAALQACNPAEPSGTITILSVDPSSGLVDGNPTTFVVEVEYELSNTSQGELAVGFNTIAVDIYAVVSSENVVVPEGSGTHVFNAAGIEPRDWSPDGDFQAFARISEYPHESVWVPLDTDTMVLTF